MIDLDRLETVFCAGLAFGLGCAVAWYAVSGLFGRIERERIRREIETREEARLREAESKIALQILRDQENEKLQWPKEIEF